MAIRDRITEFVTYLSRQVYCSKGGIVLGRVTGDGPTQEITVGSGLTLSGTTLTANVQNLTSGPVRSTNGTSSIVDGALSIAKTSGLQAALDGKSASGHTHSLADFSAISSTGGNGVSDNGKLVKFDSSGALIGSWFSFPTSQSQNGKTIHPLIYPPYYGSTSVGADFESIYKLPLLSTDSPDTTLAKTSRSDGLVSYDDLVDVPAAVPLTASKVVANAAARLALSEADAEGFAVVDADTGKSWMLVAGGTPSVSGDWLQLGDRDITVSDVSGLGTAATADASTTGGANKIPKLDAVGDLTLGSLNNSSLGDGGNLWIAPFRYVGFKDTVGTPQAGFYLWPNHSGGHEVVATSQRWCFYWSQGWQFGSPATARDGRHMYIQPNAATASDTVVESPPISLESRYWNGSANVGQSTWIQVVPSSAASGTEVLNINFGGTVGSDHRITGGVTPVKFNRTGILAAGTVQGGIWNGDAIADAYIASAATWNAKQTAFISGVLANNQTISANTNYADITGVTISLTAGTYIVDALVTTTQANGTMGSKVQMVASGTGVVNTGWTKMTANGLTHQPEYSINYGNLSWSEGRTVTSSQPCIYSAKIVVVVTSGTATLKLQAAQATSDAGNLTVLSGAMIRAEKLA